MEEARGQHFFSARGAHEHEEPSPLLGVHEASTSLAEPARMEEAAVVANGSRLGTDHLGGPYSGPAAAGPCNVSAEAEPARTEEAAVVANGARLGADRLGGPYSGPAAAAAGPRNVHPALFLGKYGFHRVKEDAKAREHGKRG